MTSEDYELKSLFDLKKILTEKNIPFAENITKLEALALLKAFEKPLFQSFADMLDEVIEIKELIGSIIEAGCTCQLFGPSGDGKTFIALDMSLSVAAGTFWNGIPCMQGLVVYFNGEGRNGFKRRGHAWKKYHNVSGGIDFYTSKQVITMDAAGVALAMSEIKMIEQRTGKKVALFVVDTLARHLVGDENSTKDTPEMIAAARAYPIERLIEFDRQHKAVAFCHADKVPSLTWHRAAKRTCELSMQMTANANATAENAANQVDRLLAMYGAMERRAASLEAANYELYSIMQAGRLEQIEHHC